MGAVWSLQGALVLLPAARVVALLSVSLNWPSASAALADLGIPYVKKTLIQVAVYHKEGGEARI